MAPSAPAAAPVPTGEHRLYALLRDIREDLLGLKRTVANMSKASATDAAVAAALDNQVQSSQTNQSSPSIDDRLAQARRALDSNDELADHWSAEVTHVANLWDSAKTAWRSRQITADESMQKLDDMIDTIENVTVPPRVRYILEQLRVGGAMDFNAEFKDEITSEATRTRMLTSLNNHPITVPGIVDVAAGIIIKASPHAWRRAASWLGILLVMAAAFAAAATTAHWVDTLQIGKVPAGAADHTYVLAVASAYAGAIFHVLISMLKQYRSASAAPNRTFTALGNFTIWVNVHETYLMLYALAIPIAAYALILTTGTINLVTVFFLGYSIDSVLDVLLNRFDTAAKKQTELVTDVFQKS